jgi:hypothetical protein
MELNTDSRRNHAWVACGGSWAFWGSAVLLSVLACLYSLKPDFAAALTIFPFWTWAPLGLVPLAAWKKLGSRSALLLFVAWLLAMANLSEEWLGFLRLPRVGGAHSRHLVIVSLNCAGGLIEAAREVEAHHPDIVLLQESPGSTELGDLQNELFGSGGGMVRGPDGAILSRFPLKLFDKAHLDATAAIATLPGGGELNIVSLRLTPPVFRPDLISPSAWSEVMGNRRVRRAEVRELSAFVGRMPRGRTIMGGDFNAQSGDAIFREMPHFLRDSFYDAGRGWCHTAVNDYPLARIDQIWISAEIDATEERVYQTINSDHRMVVLRVAL